MFTAHNSLGVNVLSQKAESNSYDRETVTVEPSPSQNAVFCRPLVLVVEDNRDQADSLAFVLRLWGFPTKIAYDGTGGLETACRYHPTAILADIGLPGMDGFELARQLRALPDFQHTPMAAVTAYGDEDTVEMSRRVGYARHFLKPVDLDELQRFLSPPKGIS